MTEIGPRVYGVVDVLRSDRIAGWAIDRSDPDASVEIDIHREGRLVVTVRADRPRADLAKGGVGTGRYGFRTELSPPLEAGFEFTVSVIARAADGTTGGLRRAGPAGKATTEQRILERVLEEQIRLARAVAKPAPRTTDEPERLRAALDRVEVIQARLEAALTAVEPVPPRPPDHGLRLILFVTLAIALGSLALGAASFLQP